MRFPRLWAYWLVFGAAAIGCFYLVPANTGASSAYYDVISVTSTAVMVVGIRLRRPTKARMWYLLAGGQALWALGDIVNTVNTYALGRDNWPAESDAVYLLAYPVLAAGLFVLIRGRTSGRDRDGLIDGSIVATGLTLVVWTFMVRDYLVVAGLPFLAGLTSIAYPIGDALLLVMLARLFVAPGARTASYRLLSAAMVILLAVDIVYAYVTATGTYQVGGVMDIGWLSFYVLWAASALHPSMRSLSETAPDRAQKLNWRRVALLAATTLLAPVILIEQGFAGKAAMAWPAVSIGAIVLFLLVLARMFGLVAQVQDQAAQLDALAHNDALTGVPNRRAWDLELARHMANARRTGDEVVVAILDLDHFKQFNDRYGHQAGDRLLKEAAAAWRAQLRSGDLLARYGGEEFGVCVTGMSVTGAATLLQRVLAATPLGQTFSGGIAAWTGDEAPERLIARADAALYEAKNAGRNHLMVHTGQSITAPGEFLPAAAG